MLLILILFILIMPNYLAQAQKNLKNYMKSTDMYFDINGKSKHLNTDDQYNEDNKGFGLTATQGNNLVKILMAGGYKNSYDKNSYYAGGGLAKRFGNKNYLDIGAVGGLVTGYNDSVSPMAAAILSLGKKDLARLNLMYTPKYQESPATLMMNLGIPFK